MDIKKAVKKIGAVLAGAALMATPAIAATLADYPAPFVQDGKFNGLIVVGATAMPEDIIGGIDIGASIQYAMRQQVSVGTGSEVTIDEGWKVQTNTVDLNLGTGLSFGDDEFANVKSKISNDELPQLLNDAVYFDNKGTNAGIEQDYVQNLYFGAGSNILTFEYDRRYAPLAADYLYMPRNTITYTYELKFDDEVPYDGTASDLISTKLEMLGKDYTITGAKFSGGILNELTLMVGDSTQWLIQNEPITKIVDGVEHKVELIDVSVAESGCLISVDGKSTFLYTGTTETINNVRIGVIDAVAIHAQLQDVDLCEVNLGADKLELRDTNKVKLNGKEIDGSNVDLSTATATGWKGFSIEYKPVDPTYIAAGKSWIDPVFGKFKYVYQGLNTDYEVIKGDTSGVLFELTFKTADKKEMVLPFYYDETGLAAYLGYGENIDELIYGDDGFLSGLCNSGAGADVRLCEGMQFIYLDTKAAGTNVAHLMELHRVEETSGGELKVTIKDVTYNKFYTQLDTDDGGAADGIINFDDFTGLTLTFDAFDLTATTVLVEGVMDFTADSITTLNGAGIYFTNVGNDGSIVLDPVVGIFEDWLGTAVKETSSSTIEFDVSWVVADTEWQILSPDLIGATASTLKQESETNKDLRYFMTEFGTKGIYDSKDKTYIDIHVPANEVTANAFVAPVGAEISTTVSGAAYQIDKIDYVGVLDTETSLGKDNLIVVGGPCVNTIAAELMGNPAVCTEGFVEGEAMIRLFTSNNKVAMLVAGYSARDTRAATRVVQNYEKYTSKFTGTSAKIVSAEILK